MDKVDYLLNHLVFKMMNLKEINKGDIIHSKYELHGVTVELYA